MSNDGIVTKDVWNSNFDAEMSIFAEKATSSHPIVSLTTRLLLCTNRIPLGNRWGNSETNYWALVENVNMFKDVVQVGLALCDELGRLPRCKDTGRPCIWEFNLMPVEAQADQLCGSVKVDKLRREGIHPARFFTQLRGCSLLMKNQISWVVFKGGVDLVAVMRLWNTGCLTLELEHFLIMLVLYFPLFYDMAGVMGFHPDLDDGMIDVSARSIGVWREDQPPFGAASDSLLALLMFMRMKMLKKGRDLLQKKVMVLFGVTPEQHANAVPTFTIAPF